MIIGDNKAIAPGNIILRREACVEMATHLSYSGLPVPSIIPGIVRNCLRTSSTIAIAASPTARIASEENINGIIPPTINFVNADEALDPKLNFTFNTAQHREVNIAMTNTFGFGGHNTSAIFKKYE